MRVYKRSAKPASLLRKGDETETETEGESSSAPNSFNLPYVWGSRWNQTGNGRAPAYPIPKFGGSLVLKKHSPLAVHHDIPKEEGIFEIDMKNSSPIPARGAERAEGNIFFESLGLVSEPTAENLAKRLTLIGTILVRNIAYHKTVVVRYTLDDWNTTNDVLAHHEKSLVALPERFLLASLPLIEDAEGCPEGEERRREVVSRPRKFDDVLVEGGIPAWDRFRFEISLEKYESSIQQRTMWCVGKYSTASPTSGGGSLTPVGGEEWWDNNSGNNYRVSFLKKNVVENRVTEADKERKQNAAVDSGTSYRRNLVFSAPPVFTPSKPFPAPPQISSSLSYPVGATSARREHAAAAHFSLTQRLKNFGLTNYAAPSPANVSSSLTASKDEQDAKGSPSETSTAETSADSTPLQTPTQDGHGLRFQCKSGHDVNTNVLVHDGEPGRDDEDENTIRWGLRGGLQMQDGYPATIGPPPLTALNDDGHDSLHTEELIPPSTTSSNPMDIVKGRGRMTVEPEPSDLEPTPAHILGPGPEMGTSPPFSLLSGMELRNGMFASKQSSGLHWPWGGDSKEETTPTHPNIVAPTPTHVTPNGAHVRISSPIQGSSTPTPLLPQRKKAHHSHQVPSFSIGRSSSSSSKSGSSGSGSSSDTTNGKRSGSSRPKLVSPQPWPLPPQNQLRRVMSPPPPGSGPQRSFEIKAEDDNGAVAVNQAPSQSPPSNASPTELATSPSNDAVYQAFVRQWCFAQGPAPNVGVGPPGKSERMRTPDVVVR